MIVYGAFLVKKRPFKYYLSKIVKIKQPKKPETRTKVDFLFERAIIMSKKPARKIGSKIIKKPIFWDESWPKLVKISHFWDKGGTISLHITYPPLAYSSKSCSGISFLLLY